MAMSGKAFASRLGNSANLRGYILADWKRGISTANQKHKAATAALQDRPDEPKADTSINKQAHQRAFDPSIPDPANLRIDSGFQNAEEAFKSKTNTELLRALLVFNLCSIRPLVDYNKQLMKVGRKLLGKSLFVKTMRSTFYGQFVGGEDEERVRPVADRNLLFGVKSILDYSVEKDLSREQAQQAEMEGCTSAVQPDDPNPGPNVIYRAHQEFGDRREHVTSARTYFYEDEAMCDENMGHFLNGIDAVSGTTNATGFAAVKLTALGRPQLLLQLSEVLNRVRRYYDVLASMDRSGKGTINQTDFDRHLKSFNLDRDERRKWYTILDTSQDGEIDLLDWHNLLEVNIGLGKLLRVPNMQSGKFESLATSFTEDEEEQMKNFLRRVDRVARYGRDKDVRIMIDAEQTYFQTAINRLTVEMMRKYNKEKAIIFNTYQCYLKDALVTMNVDLSLSEREGFYFGAKLVRGAYMEQERERALSLGYEDPINPDYEATTDMYHQVLSEVMRQIVDVREKGQIAVMVASHNEDTVRFTLEKMKECGIKSTDRLICFGQLLGMCDQVSFSLGQAGYSVYKYVPYGPVEEVLPYLSRRALENKGILSKVKKEKTLLWSELMRRLKRGQLTYSPPVPESPPTPEHGMLK